MEIKYFYIHTLLNSNNIFYCNFISFLCSHFVIFAGGGGGASDFPIDDENINSRIIVAAGGSGATYMFSGGGGRYYRSGSQTIIDSTETTQDDGDLFQMEEIQQMINTTQPMAEVDIQEVMGFC